MHLCSPCEARIGCHSWPFSCINEFVLQPPLVRISCMDFGLDFDIWSPCFPCSTADLSTGIGLYWRNKNSLLVSSSVPNELYYVFFYCICETYLWTFFTTSLFIGSISLLLATTQWWALYSRTWNFQGHRIARTNGTFIETVWRQIRMPRNSCRVKLFTQSATNRWICCYFLCVFRIFEEKKRKINFLIIQNITYGGQI